MFLCHLILSCKSHRSPSMRIDLVHQIYFRVRLRSYSLVPECRFLCSECPDFQCYSLLRDSHTRILESLLAREEAIRFELIFFVGLYAPSTLRWCCFVIIVQCSLVITSLHLIGVFENSYRIKIMSVFSSSRPMGWPTSLFESLLKGNWERSISGVKCMW